MKNIQSSTVSSQSDVFHVGRPNLGDRGAFLARVNDILDRRWLSNNGCYVQEFESRLAQMLNVKHVVATCNATAALEIASKALDLCGEVILPSYTFVATAHALHWQGITPIFADIDPRTHNIDPKKLENLITRKTTGIVGVHVWGRGCDTDAIEVIARNYDLKVMYDASHGFACSRDGVMLGGFGECEVFSFHATKFINCLEGGAVATNNSELAEKVRMMTNFGFTGYDKVEYLGINGKMNEISAAMGLTNLDAISEIVAINQRNYETYKQGLSNVPGISLIQYDGAEANNYQYVVLEIDPSSCPRKRDEIVTMLHANNFIARKYFWPGCHRMEPYRTTQPEVSKYLLQTEAVAANVIVLPTGQTVETTVVESVCALIRNFVTNQSLGNRTRR